MAGQAGPRSPEPELDEEEEETEKEATPDSPTSILQSLGPAQRAIESIIIAIITSTGLYLVGSVYTESYFGRMSIDATSLDLAPPYIALQSAHVLQSLLEYPLTLLGFYVLYRLLMRRIPHLRAWYEAIHGRFGRLFLLIVNVVVIFPLLLAAFRTAIQEGAGFASSVLGEVAELMTTAGVILLLYVIWLSLGPRLSLFSQVRQRKFFPIALLFALYLMDALVATARDAAGDAELLMLGAADSSTQIQFTWADGVQNTLPDGDLLLVIARGGAYYVVEKQPYPPSLRPVAYAVQARSVTSVRTQRVNPARQEFVDITIEIGGTPTADGQ